MRKRASKTDQRSLAPRQRALPAMRLDQIKGERMKINVNTYEIDFDIKPDIKCVNDEVVINGIKNCKDQNVSVETITDLREYKHPSILATLIELAQVSQRNQTVLHY
jgi:hypothetical protein